VTPVVKSWSTELPMDLFKIDIFIRFWFGVDGSFFVSIDSLSITGFWMKAKLKIDSPLSKGSTWNMLASLGLHWWQHYHQLFSVLLHVLGSFCFLFTRPSGSERNYRASSIRKCDFWRVLRLTRWIFVDSIFYCSNVRIIRTGTQQDGSCWDGSNPALNTH